MWLQLLDEAHAWFRHLRHPWIDLVCASALVSSLLLLCRDILRWYVEHQAMQVVLHLFKNPTFERVLRQFVSTTWREELAQTRAHHQAEIQALEARLTQAFRESLHDIVVEARRSGIPLQVTVTSAREADLIRETVGPIAVRVSRKSKSPESAVVTFPTPTGEALSVWDRLAADEPEEPCPTSENPPSDPPPPPPKGRKKKA